MAGGDGGQVGVTSADAEGRLVLADGLCWACDKENPAFIVDLATLTGGVVVALGKVYAGLWCDDDGLRGRIECAAAGAGERVWRLPHHEDYRTMMKSPIADILNSAPVREAHPIQGAAFLSYFVKGKVPCAHIDIPGVPATDHDARVLNISFAPLYWDRVVARQAALSRLQGAVVVIASGNSGFTSRSTGTSDILFVGATDSDDVIPVR